MKTRTTRIAALAAGLMILVGCGTWPPVADTKSDVERLPVSTDSLRARSLCDADIPSLSRLRELQTLDFWSGDASYPARFTDKGLATLASLDLPHLQLLFFGYCTNITDRSLDPLIRMRTIKCLKFVACPGITDTGLQKLAGLNHLTFLDLRGCTNVTDRGIEFLGIRTNWQMVLLGGCPNVSLDVVASLKRRIPGADVQKDDQEWSYH